jgi:hypothetical protein
MTLHALNLPGGERPADLTVLKRTTSPEFQKEPFGFPRIPAKETARRSLRD